ncbi:aromatic acid exporter family protein [Metabacillus litoralis]|uniref:aromatic acid exporter family protein n=1 Tax=Metabacillus litoralis TaxID=152268 RepID=UPI000EF60AEB|nr:aromatic acid exporter family protein [Metabacillus litoralis]
MKLGARILKTGIAITLALFLATVLQLPSPAFAGISAIFAIQPTIYRSYLSIIEQVQANVIGAALAIGFGLIFGSHPFVIGLTAIIVIAINLRLKIESTIPVSLVTVIAILESPGENFIEIASIRFFTVMLGVLAAFIVNLVFIPPKYETKLYNLVTSNTEDIIKWIRVNLRHASEHTVLKDDIEKFKEQMIKLDQLYLNYKEERNYFKRETYSKSRKLVLFRQMIVTTNRALDTLKKLHRLENDLHHMPEHFQKVLVKELDHLLYVHEEALLRFIGKTKTIQSTELLEEDKFNKQHLMDAYMELQQNQNSTYFFHLLPLVSTIIDYSEQLEHLDTLIYSFHSYHKQDNEIKLSEE